jgi:HPr kinase/phosphorylase
MSPVSRISPPIPARTAAPTLTVGSLFERMRETLRLELVPGCDGLDREIASPNVSSPGLVLSGYVDRFPAHRLQVLGETEITYLQSLTPEQRRRNLTAVLSFPIPCVFITKGQQPGAELRELACAAGVPLIISALKTNEFYSCIKPWLEEEFAPTTNLHGSLADIFGVGLLFVGRSGIGKSECVLDLVERGHRLVADDLVIARRRGTDLLIGRGHELQRHFMEIRGVGLVDIPAIFGIRAVRQQKRIEVVVQLEEWDHDAPVDRTGLDGEVTSILDVELPKVRVPLNPGKNITVIAEVIAMNHLLKYSGIDPAERFNDRLLHQMRGKRDVRRYLQEDNE